MFGDYWSIFCMSSSLIILSHWAIKFYVWCRSRVCIIQTTILIYMLSAWTNIRVGIHLHLLCIGILLKHTWLIWITAYFHIVIAHRYRIEIAAVRGSHVFLIHLLHFNLLLALYRDGMDITVSLVCRLIHIRIHFLIFYFTGLNIISKLYNKQIQTTILILNYFFIS